MTFLQIASKLHFLALPFLAIHRQSLNNTCGPSASPTRDLGRRLVFFFFLTCPLYFSLNASSDFFGLLAFIFTSARLKGSKQGLVR